MSILQNKVDFVALISVARANSNGDPLNGNRPRTDLNGFGEISDVCIKRKIRNRMQDLGEAVFVQSEDRCTDGFGSLSERASASLKGIKDREEYARRACETWLDVRTFGQVFAFKDTKGFSCGVRGPVSIHQASSISPVEIESIQITKSVNGEKKGKDENRASDTMGMKPVPDQGFDQRPAGGKDRLYRGGCGNRQGMPAHTVCQRCLLCPARWLHGGGEAVLVEAQLQGWAVFLREGPPQCPDSTEGCGCDSELCGGL